MVLYNLENIYVNTGYLVIGDKDWFISKGADPSKMKDGNYMYCEMWKGETKCKIFFIR